MTTEAGGTITWSLVIVGWVATHFFTLQREKRKEVRAKLDDIRLQLAELEVLITSFHTANAFSSEKARAIILSIQRVSREIEREPKLKIETSRFRFDLRKAATLTNFDKSSFKQLEHDHQLLDQVASCHDKLVSQLELNYITYYRDTFF